MKLPEICIRRPVFTIVISLIFIIIGIISYQRLALRELPVINKPVALVKTLYQGASSQLMESRITTPIENALSSVSGIDEIKSSSSRGESNIRIRFKLGTNLDAEVNDVRNAIAHIEDSLPDGADRPEVIKFDPDATQAVILSFSDKNQSPLELTDYINRYIKPQLEQLIGVGQVRLYGDREYAMRIWLDPVKMAAHHVTVSDIDNALQSQNVNVATGQIKARNRYYTVLINANFDTVSQFRNIIVRQINGNFVRLADVANVKVGPEDTDGMMRVDGKPAVGVGVYAQSTANPIKVAEAVKRVLKKLKTNIPEGMHARIVYNAAIFIHQSIYNVYETIFEAILLVLVVVYLFLGSIRSASIPIVTIPICLIATFTGLYILSYTINTITLLALVLAIGLVVDDAIVVLENIYRHIESGTESFQAAIKGSQEIVFAVIAMTITLAAVYAPVGFTRNITGTLFRQFAFTLAIAVLISGFIALTLSPMMCARLLKNANEKGVYGKWLDSAFYRFKDGYKKILNIILGYRHFVLVILLLLATGGILIYRHLPQQLAPLEDEGTIMGIVNAPTDASFHYTNQYVKQLEKIYSKIPEVQDYITFIEDNAPDEAYSFINLKPWSKRGRSEQQITNQLKKSMAKIPGVIAFPVEQSPLGHGDSSHHAISLMLTTSGSYLHLHQVAKHFINVVDQYKQLTNVNDDLDMDSQQFSVDINRNLAADLNINLNDINNTLATLLGGTNETHFQYKGQTYDVMLQMKQHELHDLNAFGKIYVRNKNDQMIPLSNLLKINSVIGTTDMPHFNRLRADEFSAELAPGVELGQAVSLLQHLAEQNLPDDTQYTFVGAAKRFLETRSDMNMAFLLALIFIYLVLSAQFESFIDPLIILLSVPLTLVAAIFVLKLTGGSLNIYSEIGLVTLIGLISKHGILITEFANQLRAEGFDKMSAIIEASSLRLRPILMTTAAMVLGAIPLALATGADAHSRQQLGIVIVSGMLFGTFFSLFVVPSAYCYLAKSDKSILDYNT